jgi:hypothetical protein
MADGLPSDAGWWAAAATGVPLLGGGVAWVLGWWGKRSDSYHSRLRAWDADIRKREETLDSAVKDDISELKAKVERLTSDAAATAIAVERWRISVIILVNDTIMHRSEAPALRQVRDVLAEAFPVHLQTPADMVALVAKIDGRNVV